MPITDNDLQVLEEWLDGELTEEQGTALRQRMATEPGLAAALDRLRDERRLRSRLFTVLEPGERETDIFCTNLRREIRREDVWASRVRGMRKIASLAAMITVVFMAGWISRERLTTAGSATASNQGVGRPAIPLHPDNTPQMARLIGSDNPGTLQFGAPQRSIDLSRIPFANGDRRYQVIIRDSMGREFVPLDPRMLPPGLLLVPQQQQPLPVPPQGRGVLVNEVGGTPQR